MEDECRTDGNLAVAGQKKVIVIEAAERQQNVKLRVKAYIRVSSDSEDQLNSFAAQNQYYSTLISYKENWTMADIYADRGITGTSVEKREEFQRLLADCRRGLIDRVLCKSISRNDTLGVQMRMKNETFNAHKHLFGYRLNGNKMEIFEPEAKPVQEIFHRFLRGQSCNEIAAYMNSLHIPTRDGRTVWPHCTIKYILQNRKYIGEQGWPAIITVEMYEYASQKRTTKITVAKKTEAQKVLRRLCVGNATPDVEQNVLHLINNLIASPEKIHMPQVPPADRLQSELDQQPVNEESAKSLAMELAATQFSVIGDQAYETERLRQLFAQYVSLPELDAELLRSAVSVIYIRKSNVTTAMIADLWKESRA